jgi:glycine oxidase
MPAQGGFLSEHKAGVVDVAVIGGGVIGLAIAWRAAQSGLRVVVLERGVAGGGASWVAAGMLAPVAEATAGEGPLLELGLRGALTYNDFAAELAAASGAPNVGYTRCGTLLVARDSDEAQALERELELRRRFGLAVQRLRPSQARRLEPGLAPSLRLALQAPDDHAVDPRALTRALIEAVSRAGGEVRESAEVAALCLGRERVGGVRMTDGSVVVADQVVVAAGAWSNGLAGIPPPARIPVRPVKGQILRLHDPAGPGLLSRVIRMGSSYITPRGDGRYVIGASTEERGFDTTVTAGAAFELLRDASELVPGISELVIDEFSAGLRPGTPDNLPVIGGGDIPGLLWATGHRRGGILLAPITAELIVRELRGEPPDDLAAAFSPARWQRAPAGSAA